MANPTDEMCHEKFEHPASMSGSTVQDDGWDARLMNLIDVNPITGSIVWLFRGRDHFNSDQEWARWNSRYAHTPAFDHLNDRGYKKGGFENRSVSAHRLIWRFVHGTWPNNEIDHINGNKSDNRLVNLRAVTRVENCRNAALNARNTSGCAGVNFHSGSWIARIGTGEARVHLGTFKCFDDAVAARKNAEAKLGYSTRHGVPLASSGGH